MTLGWGIWFSRTTENVSRCHSSVSPSGTRCLVRSLVSSTRRTKPGEHTYKLALRASFLLGKDLDERRKIREAVEGLYVLRSKAVHGTHSAKPDDDATSLDGLKVCARVLEVIVRLNKMPDWKELELAGGLPLRDPNQDAI